jgi:Protein of unknown function (DUF3732)
VTFQIRAIHLYNAMGERRSLPFVLNTVNIITGRSATGKSSVIDIIDYCLGSSGFPVAAGVIRETVSIYAVELETRNGPLVIARAAPRGKSKSNSQLHINYRPADAAPPTPAELKPNADLNSAINYLSRILGIEENVTDVGHGRRVEYDVTIRHALFFCIQAQDEIANQDLLFHGQGDEYRPQAIRDALPYFLGVTDPAYLMKREVLRTKERELRALERQASDERSLSEAPGRAAALVSEAAALGLVPESQDLSRASAIETLARALESDFDPQSPIEPTDELASLFAQREELRADFSRFKAEQRNIRKLLRYEDEFNGEAGERNSRLQSLRLLKLDPEGTEDTSECPVCSSPLADSITSVVEIREQLERVGREISDVNQQQSRLQLAAISVEQRLASLGTELTANQRQIDQVSESIDLFDSLRDISLQRAAVRGRISLFLSSVSRETESTFLSGRIEELNREIIGLRAQLDPEVVAERLSAALSRISYRITDIASKLELEHAPAPVRLDVRSLTVIVDTAHGSYQLREIGSAANWLGYHLAAFIGLHGFLVENGRPVPRFLLLDQPSQVYFPPDSTGRERLDDADHAALSKVFNALFEFTEESEEKGGFQILVMEHADLNEERFEYAIVERWRADDEALIPQSWLSK